jgi:hypothetical protein
LREESIGPQGLALIFSAVSIAVAIFVALNDIAK